MDAREVQNFIRQAAREGAKEAVHETLRGLGLAVDEPHETQADLIYLRKLRTSREFLGLSAKKAAIACFVPAMLYFLWRAFKDSLRT